MLLATVFLDIFINWWCIFRIKVLWLLLLFNYNLSFFFFNFVRGCWCWASLTLGVGDARPPFLLLSLSILTSCSAYNTNLSSALFFTPSAVGFMTQKRPAEVRSMSHACEGGSCHLHHMSNHLFCLPDHIQNLYDLLIDDENYGHIKTYTAKPGNCSFIEPVEG